jgi:poly(3-hydroxybutyrate) depolymerase
MASRRRLRPVAAILAAALAMSLAGIAGRGGAQSPSLPPEREVSASLSDIGCAAGREERQAREFTLRLASSQGERTALVRVPARAAVARSPLVVALHGGGRSGRFMERYSGLARVGDRAGFGHQWPGATPPDPGPPSTFSAAQQAWAFLAPLRAPRGG